MLTREKARRRPAAGAWGFQGRQPNDHLPLSPLSPPSRGEAPLCGAAGGGGRCADGADGPWRARRGRKAAVLGGIRRRGGQLGGFPPVNESDCAAAAARPRLRPRPRAPSPRAETPACPRASQLRPPPPGRLRRSLLAPDCAPMKKTNMWFLERFRGSGENGAAGGEGGDKAAKGPLYSNVLTPDKIPDFFIPPKLPAGPAEPEAQAELGPSTSEQNLASAAPRRAPRSPRLPAKLAAESKSLLKAATRHVIQIESAEDWPAEETATNADPQAQGAMSLPSVPKAQTSYGFATLAESPHTRRKESLFHSEHGALAQVGSPGTRRRRGGVKANGGDGGPREAGGTLMSPGRCVSGGESDTGSSAESSPFGSPLLSRSVSLLKGFAQDSQAKVSQLKHSVGRHGSLSADDSTPDTSPGPGAACTAGPPGARPESGPASRAEHAVRMGPRAACTCWPSTRRPRPACACACWQPRAFMTGCATPAASTAVWACALCRASCKSSAAPSSRTAATQCSTRTSSSTAWVRPACGSWLSGSRW
uniref:C2 calcium dependent domain containing 4C n=1 Tax=Bos mutus grunniens TaxID=30521 RepID=A0A8C0A5W2_BOSMU